MSDGRIVGLTGAFVFLAASMAQASDQPSGLSPLPEMTVSTIITDEAGSSYVAKLVAQAEALLSPKSGERNPALAASMLREAVKAGDPGAMVLLADLLVKGDGVTVNLPEARDLLEAAVAKGGAALGARALGELYMSATPVRDPLKAVTAYEKGAAAGDLGSAVALATMLSDGKDVPVDAAAASSYLEQAVALAPADLIADKLAPMFLDVAVIKDPVKAAAAFQKAVDGDNTNAMLALARLLSSDDGIPTDGPRALALIENAIKLGEDYYGYVALGDLYIAKTSIRDPQKAVEAYNRAVKLDNSGAMIKLAVLLTKGDVGLDAAPTKAKALLEKAIVLKNVTYAADALGDFYLEDTPFRSPEKAVESYQRAADEGNTWSMIKLADLLITGDKVAPDLERARHLLEKVVAAGNPWGAEMLGDLFLADTPFRDPNQAAAAYLMAADNNITGPMVKLAQMLIDGKEIPKSDERAAALLERVVANGDASNAGYILGDLYFGESTVHDPQKALVAYEKAGDAGNTWAMLKLGWTVATGDQVPADPARGEALIKRAIDEGNVSGGADWLGDLYFADTPLHDVEKGIAAYEQATAAGSAGASIKLANLFLNGGEGIEPDLQRAVGYLETALRDDTSGRAGETLGNLYLDNDAIRDVPKAIAAYQKAADAGNASAMMKLAALLTAGQDAPRNPSRAAGLLQRAIDAGSASVAGETLGDLYNSDPALLDASKAEAAYLAAANAGNTWGMIKLATLLGIPSRPVADQYRAQKWLNEAIEKGDPQNGGEALGDLYLADTQIRDPIKAADAYQLSADAGGLGAMIKLGRMLATGNGIPADRDKALALIQAAIDKGDASRGGEALGDLYLIESALRDPDDAVKAYQQSVDAGNTWSMIKLARILSVGDGVAKDPETARNLIEQAIDAGNTEYGPEALGDFYLLDTPLRHPPKAADAYQRGADAGNASAMLKLADMLIAGNGIAANQDRAIALLETAISKGSAGPAAIRLGNIYLNRNLDGDRLKARQALQIAAASGNPDALFALALLDSEDYRKPTARDEMLKNLIEAARLVGSDVAAVKMIQLPEPALVMSVQTLLSGNGFPVSLDGVFGGQTARAIGEYCSARGIADCSPTFITTGLLSDLLRTETEAGS